MPFFCVNKSWKQSLSFLSRKEFLLFIFSWLHTFKRSFPIFLKYFWWLALLEIVFRNTYFSIFPLSITSMLFIFFSTLSIRASVCNKDWSYFVSNSLKIISFFPVYLFAFLLINLAIGSHTNILITAGVHTLSYNLMNTIMQTSLAGLILLAIFFLLDGETLAITPLKAFKCATKLVINYFPLLSALLFLYNALYSLILFTLSPLHPYLIITILLGYNFFFICAVHIVYLKIRYSNYNLFFRNE